MREGWEERPLGDLCAILDSRRRPITKRDRVPGEIPYYGATGVLDYVSGFIFDEPLVLVGEDGAKWGVGERTAFPVDGPTWINNHAHVLRPNRSAILDKWLIYYLNNEDLSAFITGLTVPKLNQEMLRSIPVPFPPLAEQQRIVAILDEAFEAIAAATANAEKNLANAGRLLQAELDRKFREGACRGWQRTTFGAIADIKGGKRVPNGYKLQVEPTPHPYIPVGAFESDGGIDLSKVRYIDDDVYRVICRYIVRKEDLYISIAETVGKTGVVSDELDGANLTENACRLIFGPDISNRFVYYFTKSTDFEAQALHQTRTTAQPKLALKRLAAVELCVPELEEQQAVVQAFDNIGHAVSALKANYACKLAALAELKQSLLARAFCGALTANHGDDDPHTPSLRAEGEATQGRRTGGGSLRRSAPRDDGGKGAVLEDHPPIPTFPAAAKRSAGTQGKRTDG